MASSKSTQRITLLGLYEAGLQHALVDLGGIYECWAHCRMDKGGGLVFATQTRRVVLRRAERGALGRIQVVRGAITTSGGYERYMTVNGKRYGHILNPKTGGL